MTLWTCWSIPVTSIDPLHDPKISPENSEQASTLDELPGSHRNWFQKYLLQQRIRHAALAWSGCSLFSSLLIWFQPESLSSGLLLLLSFFFLVLCCAWTWFRINEEDALKKLGISHSGIAEKLRTQFELDQNDQSSFLDGNNGETQDPEKVFQEYFKKKHQQELLESIRGVSPKVGWFSASVFTLSIQAMLIGFFFLGTDSIPGNNAISKMEVLPSGAYRILFPAYLKKSPQQYETLPDELSTPLGSQLEMSWMDPPFQKDESYFVNSRGRIPLQWSERGPQILARLTPENSGLLKLGWESREIPWKVIPDQKPILKVNWPQLKYIFDSSRMKIQVFAEDDHALHQVVLHYQVQSNDLPYKEILQSYEEDFKIFSELYEWDLSMTPLLAGDNVTVWIEASDRDLLNGPNRSVSEKFVFQLESQSEYHQKILARFEDLHSAMKKLMGKLDLQSIEDTDLLETQIISEMKTLREDASHDLLLSGPLKAFPAEIEMQLNFYRRQRQLLEKPECVKNQMVPSTEEEYRERLESIEACLSN